jgi:hypothetical protein
LGKALIGTGHIEDAKRYLKDGLRYSSDLTEKGRLDSKILLSDIYKISSHSYSEYSKLLEEISKEADDLKDFNTRHDALSDLFILHIKNKSNEKAEMVELEIAEVERILQMSENKSDNINDLGSGSEGECKNTISKNQINTKKSMESKKNESPSIRNNGILNRDLSRKKPILQNLSSDEDSSPKMSKTKKAKLKCISDDDLSCSDSSSSRIPTTFIKPEPVNLNEEVCNLFPGVHAEKEIILNQHSKLLIPKTIVSS